MRTAGNGCQIRTCVFGCPLAEDRVEHYILCSKVWSFLSRPRPSGLGIDPTFRNHTSMLLGRGGMHQSTKVAIALAVYAISRAAHTVRCSNNGTLDVHRLLKL